MTLVDPMIPETLNDGCKCQCHYGGAISCPSCKENHGTHGCPHCR